MKQDQELYIVERYLLSPKKNPIEKLLNKYNLCGPILNLNSVWAFRIISDVIYYLICKDKCVKRTNAGCIAFAIDEIRETNYIICSDEMPTIKTFKHEIKNYNRIKRRQQTCHSC